LSGALSQLRGPWDIVFYNAGVDPYEGDRLGRLSLSTEGLRHRDRMVIDHFRSLGTPVCGVVGGGYSRDIAELAARHAILFEVAEAYA
jgi:acetoin utilization deacetylase AcuC-like enzyme